MPPTTETFDLPDARLDLIRDWLTPAEAETAYTQLCAQVAWRQEAIRLFGRTHLQPRLTAWYGDPGTVYTYSGLRLEPRPWLPLLRQWATRLHTETGYVFNSVLLNHYRDGQDSMGWHSDDEPELGPAPVIASVSLGATRRFALRHRHRPEARLRLDLPAGSLLLMGAGMQAHWQHALPKTRKAVSPRLNLTFRQLHARD